MDHAESARDSVWMLPNEVQLIRREQKRARIDSVEPFHSTDRDQESEERKYHADEGPKRHGLRVPDCDKKCQNGKKDSHAAQRHSGESIEAVLQFFATLIGTFFN